MKLDDATQDAMDEWHGKKYGIPKEEVKRRRIRLENLETERKQKEKNWRPDWEKI